MEDYTIKALYRSTALTTAIMPQGEHFHQVGQLCHPQRYALGQSITPDRGKYAAEKCVRDNAFPGRGSYAILRAISLKGATMPPRCTLQCDQHRC